jgi:ribosomal protein S27AE
MKSNSKSNSKYIIQPALKSHCPKCGRGTYLLCHKDWSGPAFYICFGCRYVGEVGKGPVRDMSIKLEREKSNSAYLQRSIG